MRSFTAIFISGIVSVSAADIPLRALLVCGGCCHDYAKQSVILKDGIQARAKVMVDVVRSSDGGTKPWFPMYESKDWAKGYDVVIHDECAADIKDAAYVQNIVDAHKAGLPAVNLHCAMHSYRTGTDVWFEFLGLQSSSHGPKKPIVIGYNDSTHPVIQGFAGWTTGDEELYNNIKIFDSAKPLALGNQVQDKGNTETAVIVWTNNYHGTRVFNTSVGHENQTVADPRYLDLVVRGLLWSCDKLNPVYLKPYTGPQSRIDVLAPKGQPADYKSSGNPAPRNLRPGAAKELEILKDVKVADGFDVTLFSTSAQANYPVYVAAAPNGDLYVASDGNGSLGIDPGRGRIIRLRDTDDDGRADQVIEFAGNVNAPRGMVWDHDRLYVLHAPDMSCFIDRDGDGRADEKEILVKGISFSLDKRPADHTTNGLTLGIDGWIYIAGGDFGFLDAVGSDGKCLRHRAGGVLRVRPDGSGLEIFSTGTRNILGTPVSPLLDIFARDNTNDGGGWAVRFHHFTGLEDHGYPRMHNHFQDEIVLPLSDYGGGSGCGSVYLSEPGFPAKWNDAPLTCDWGTNALWHHSLEPVGVSFKETRAPEALVKMTRPTDADVDGMSRLYQASWKGATFKWEGPDVGYIVRISPKGYVPEPLPDFGKSDAMDLVRLLESPSQVRTLEAQRTLLRRPSTPAMHEALLALAGNPEKPLPARVAALFAISQRGLKGESSASVIAAVGPMVTDPELGRFALRALGDVGLDGFLTGKTTAPEALYAGGLQSPDGRTQLEAIVGATRQNMRTLAPGISGLLGNSEKVIAHTAFRALAMLGATDACFAVLDDAGAPQAKRTGALRALMRIHRPESVSGLIARMEIATDPGRRAELLAALCRLHFTEGDWKGDSWGTRPDTRGPYYQPEAWSETPRVAAALKAALAKATPGEATALVRELRRNRIEFNESIARIMTLVKTDPALLPELVMQLAATENLPSEGIPFLITAAKGDFPAPVISQAVATLAKTDSEEGFHVSLAALGKLSEMKDAEKQRDLATTAFLTAPKLESRHGLLETLAAKMDGSISSWADAALLALSARKDGSPESRELSKKAIDHGWQDAKRRVQILKAIRATGFRGLDDKVRTAMEDVDASVAAAAREAAKALKLEQKGEDKSPLVATLKPEAAIAAVMKTKGDVAVGKQLFARQTCTACHAATMEEPQKGPYLGNIAQTYGRADLAGNILDPGKTIAQGFATELFTLKDGSQQMGFVTLESADEIKVRNIAAQEFNWKTLDVAKREKLPNSLMPPGLVSGLTVREFASLLDYLESLSKK